MPSKINKPVLKPVIKRYNLAQGVESLYMPDEIQPVFDIDQTLWVLKGQSTTSPNGTTRTDTYTCPLGKLWRMKAISLYRAQASSIAVQLTISGTTYVFNQQASANFFNVDMYDILIKEGDSIVITFNSGTSGALESYILYEEIEV